MWTVLFMVGRSWSRDSSSTRKIKQIMNGIEWDLIGLDEIGWGWIELNGIGWDLMELDGIG